LLLQGLFAKSFNLAGVMAGPEGRDFN
jgi:hypothetical protein